MKDKLITKNWGKDKIDLRTKGSLALARLDEIHLKDDGTIYDEPSFCLVLTIPNTTFIASEVSEEMLREGLLELGYKLERVKGGA